MRQAIRAESSPFSLGGVDSNSRAELPSWQESRATVHCGSRGRGAASRRRAGPERQFVYPEIERGPSRLAASTLHEEGRLQKKVEAPGEAWDGGTG